MSFLKSLFFLGFGVLCALSSAHAQEASRAFSTTAYALDAQTLSGKEAIITLWGVDSGPARGTPDATRARALLDDMMADRPIRCLTLDGDVAKGDVLARCLNGEERDLALMMIGAGQVAVNRRAVTGTDLAGAYLGAERQARAQKLGIWGGASAQVSPAEDGGMMAGLTGAVPMWAIAGALLLVPLLGFLIIGIIMHLGFRQLITLQRYQIAGTQKRERQLKEREKYVIASALEGEIHTNRAKLDAFLVIYEELLKSLRDPSKTPKYQRAGDIIHEKPSLSRTVYDAHVDKLDLLGPQLSSDLANLYASIMPNPDYRTLEPEVPIEKAREIVDKIVRNAERIIEPMDKLASALSIIVRDKRGAVSVTE